jgi:hypothetical protein
MTRSLVQYDEAQVILGKGEQLSPIVQTFSESSSRCLCAIGMGEYGLLLIPYTKKRHRVYHAGSGSRW